MEGEGEIRQGGVGGGGGFQIGWGGGGGDFREGGSRRLAGSEFQTDGAMKLKER